ncbi:MAG: iron ABC transporter permease [Anaerolineae bacterium]|nr:iron ABC transporter permease [Caldilineales bacterium]MDW8268672.1 iron ABC transporter permease [Anaerolineae bacterium]
MTSRTWRQTSSLERWARASSPRRPPLVLTWAAAVVAGLMLLPVVYLLVRAAESGFGGLATVLQPRTMRVLWNSVLLTAVVTLAAAVVAIPLAWLTVRTDLPARRLWSVLTALPLTIPSYVGAFALIAFFGPRGMLQEWLAPFGVQRLPEIYGFVGAAYALTLFTYPYLLLTVRAGLQRLDPALEEAARSLGESRRRVFWRVTLPSLRPAIAAGALLVALYVLSDFGAVSLLRFTSFTRAIYLSYQSSFDRSLAAWLSLFLVALTILILVAEQHTQTQARYYRQGTGVSRRPQPIRLGRWRWPALAFCATVVGLALVAPVSVVLVWLVRGVRAGNTLHLATLERAALNTALAAGLAALTAVLAALPIAYLAVRYPGRLTGLAERVAYVGHGLPGIVVALSLVFFGANYARPLYQTLPMLVFAYVVLFLPQAVGVLRSNLMQNSPRLEEAARSLGLKPVGVWWRVTLPLLRPGMLAGAALVFLTTAKELPATLLLAPTGFDTLATRIWSAAAEGFFARAAAPALILLVVSGLSLFLLLSQEESA